MKLVGWTNPAAGHFNCSGKYVMPQPVSLPGDAFCRNCESYDAHFGDCHNPHSDRFNPEPGHVCAAWFRSTTEG